MPRQDLTENQLRDFAAEHLTYEANMLSATAQLLATGGQNHAIKNALLESFTIHLRALIDFLWEPDKPRPDDAVASDYFASIEDWKDVQPAFPPTLDPARKRTGKEIAHLTYSRLSVTTEQKQWKVLDMANAVLSALVVFKANALSSRVGDALADLFDE